MEANVLTKRQDTIMKRYVENGSLFCNRSDSTLTVCKPAAGERATDRIQKQRPFDGNIQKTTWKIRSVNQNEVKSRSLTRANDKSQHLCQRHHGHCTSSFVKLSSSRYGMPERILCSESFQKKQDTGIVNKLEKKKTGSLMSETGKLFIKASMIVVDVPDDP
ncbi:hypothetical protein C0J52_18214 [Blattella germanica]|nr:hypothetical protein C0J52_18214 [Blattella germanica]